MSTIERIALVVSIAIVIAGGVWLAIVSHKSPAPSTPMATQPATPDQPQAKGGMVSSVLKVQVGDVGAVDAGVGMTDVATSAKALIGLSQAGASRNQAAYDKFFANGLAFRVPDGTPAKLVVGGDQVNQVQFTQGALAGKTGWIPAEWIRPANSIPKKDR